MHPGQPLLTALQTPVDVAHDEAEHDVAAEHPEEVKRLQAAYDAMNKDVPVVEEVKRVPYKK